MGYSGGIEQASIDRKNKEEREKTILANEERLNKIDNLKQHPNYKNTEPYDGEDIIQFTLRTAAHLVSPPQEPEESYEVECVDIRDGILALEDEIRERYYNRQLGEIKNSRMNNF